MNAEHMEEVPGPGVWQGIPDAVSWDVAYHRYRRLFLAALAYLAARGYPAPPDEGIDLIHDFFLESWRKTVTTYDPARGKFETYIYAAFLRFARPRIIRLLRWRSALVAPRDIAEYSSQEFKVAPSQEGSIDLNTVRRATSKLSSFKRELLIAYVGNEGSTERDLAHRFSLSRHQLRSHLADALGQTAAYLAELSAVDEPALDVAIALWRDGRSVKETAHLLRLPTSEVQAIRAGMYKRLVLAVKGTRRMHAETSEERADTTSQEEQKEAEETPERLLSAAMADDAADSDLEAIRQNAELVLAFLDDPASEEFFAVHAARLTPAVLQKIYSSIAEDMNSEADSNADLQPFLEARDDEERSIGEAFAQTLLPNLPHWMKSFTSGIFLGAPRIDPSEYAHLLTEGSVMHGGNAARELALFGITPVTILEAAQAVSMLARRFCRSAGIERYSSFVLDKVGRTEGYSLPPLARESGVKEIVAVTQLPIPTAERLFDWITRVAEYTPMLFGGFEAHLWGDELRLQRTDVTEEDLFSRWFTPPQEMAA